MSGFFGIGIENTKTGTNVGTLWRSAQIMGASFIFTIGNRYKLQSSDTLKTPRHIPLYNHKTFDGFYESIPYDCILVGVELTDSAMRINTYKHPKRCIYLLGAEDHGLTSKALNACHQVIRLPGECSLNVAVAGSIVMYDRINKQL
jgi:tRNA G18 (ribose-2'-O)-methylase SpoU